jgi:phage shock protein PspC (stress-responsive transcriptional regulator)
MKKTISISVSNMLFHVEDDACEVLQNYLSTLKNHFASEEGGEEIYNDIQARAAEILQSKNSATKQVITAQDVNDLIAKLGTPADFGMEENKSNQQKENTNKNTNFTFGNTTKKIKRLYRDADNKVIGGVCSGIGYYFGFDPVWLRIGLAASLLFYGFGFIPYIILLIVVPKAETTSEKLEMRGEPVNVENIAKMMQDELKGVGTRVGKFGADLNNSIENDSRNFFEKSFGFLGDVFSGIFKVIYKIIQVCFIILGVILFFSLIPVIMAYFSGSNKELAYFINGIFPDSTTELIGVWSVILLCLGPIIGLLYTGIRLLIGQKEKNKWVGAIVGLCITFGVAGLVYAQLKIQDQFEYTAENPETEKLDLAVDTLKVSMVENNTRLKSSRVPKIYRNRWFGRTNFKLNNLQYFETDSSEFFGGKTELDISLADSNYFELIINKKSNGPTKSSAKVSAEKILYSYKTENNQLLINKLFSLQKDEKWRNQEVELELKVPENKIIYLEKEMGRALSKVKNLDDFEDYELPGHYLKMTKAGLLCVDCGNKNASVISSSVIIANGNSVTTITKSTGNDSLAVKSFLTNSKAKSEKQKLIEERKNQLK